MTRDRVGSLISEEVIGWTIFDPKKAKRYQEIHYRPLEPTTPDENSSEYKNKLKCHSKLICKSIICDIPQRRTIGQFSCWQMASCKSSNSAFLTQAAGGWYRLVHNSTNCYGLLHARGTGAQRWNIGRNRGAGIPQSARCNFAIASSEASPP